MEILLIVLVSTLNIVCFCIGAKVGQKVVRAEPLEIPQINPVKAYREHQEHKATEREQSKLDTILRNVETYDGTGLGQVDVPG